MAGCSWVSGITLKAVNVTLNDHLDQIYVPMKIFFGRGCTSRIFMRTTQADDHGKQANPTAYEEWGMKERYGVESDPEGT
jgi:hypothetical protein